MSGKKDVHEITVHTDSDVRSGRVSPTPVAGLNVLLANLALSETAVSVTGKKGVGLTKKMCPILIFDFRFLSSPGVSQSPDKETKAAEIAEDQSSTTESAVLTLTKHPDPISFLEKLHKVCRSKTALSMILAVSEDLEDEYEGERTQTLSNCAILLLAKNYPTVLADIRNCAPEVLTKEFEKNATKKELVASEDLEDECEMAQTLSNSEILLLAQNNPGAITVLADIRNCAPEVLTKEFEKNATKKELVGSRLWAYYKDTAQCDLQKVIDEIMGK